MDVNVESDVKRFLSGNAASTRDGLFTAGRRTTLNANVRTRSTASFLSGNRVIFNVKGNLYRLEVTVAYKTSTVVVTWAGSHADYDKRN
jgi:hypothetical protein